MRGESSEAIVGMGLRGEGGGVGGGSAKDNTASPPLSAAASQISLAPSDLTTSDPDLASSSGLSSAASSRPPSSSQVSISTASPDQTPVSSRPPSSSDITIPELTLPDYSSFDTSPTTPELISPEDYTKSIITSSELPLPSSEEYTTVDITNAELTLPAPEDYTTETVEFPTSPRALKSESKRAAGVCFLEAEEYRSASPNFLSPNYRPDELESSDNSPKQGNGFEVSSDIEEDYFEEFHLPNSHENAFVRHKSFRRKVNLTPINAPDAEKIEGLVRTGEFQRHGSIRRRIVSDDTTPIPEDQQEGFDFTTDRVNKNLSSGEVGTFDKDLKEIENMLDGHEDLGNVSDIVAGEEPMCDNIASKDSSNEGLKQANTSTPKSDGTDAKTNSDGVLTDMSFSLDESSVDESMSIEQSTLMKVRECMDFTKYKDMYNLSGRLQDILSPKEIEEVLNNSEKYRDYVNQEVIEALHSSLQEHQSIISVEQTDQQNTSIVQTDSGISSPKKMISAEGLDLESAVTSEIRAVIDESPVEENYDFSSKRSSLFLEDDDEDEDENGFRLERRRSIRLSKKGLKEVEVEGVFVESKSDDIGLKKIRAPALDLSVATSEEVFDESEPSNVEPLEVPPEPVDKVPESSSPIEEQELPSQEVPDIVITLTGEDNREDNRDESEISNLLIESSDLSEITTCTEGTPKMCTRVEHTPEEDRPKSLEFGIICHRKKISVAEDILRSPIDDDAISVASAFSHRSDDEDELDDEVMNECLDNLDNLECSVPANLKFGDTCHMDFPLPPPPPQMIPELTALEESTEERHWRSVVIGGVWHRIDMKVIAPYRKCISHGGYLGDNQNAVIVICACQLPDRARRDYNYIMDNLFLYVLSTLEQLVAEDYVLLYLAGGTPRSSMPSFHWLKRAYQMIDRKLRKNLKSLHVVHPTFWVRTVVAFSRPFISTKFYRKLMFVNNLTELAQIVPLDQLQIPDSVKQADFELMIREKKRNAGKRRAYSATAR